MPSFWYKGVNGRGEAVSGKVDAADRTIAIKQLRLQEIVLLEVTEGKERFSFLRPLVPKLAAFNKISRKEVALIARQLSTLLYAGAELDRALDILLSFRQRNVIKETIEAIRMDIRSGKALSEALTNQRDQFPGYFISTVRAGEASASLPLALKQLAEVMEFQIQIGTQFISSLIYPAILVTATLASVVLIMTTVIPQFEPIFHQAGQDLPYITQVVVGFSRGLIRFGPHIFLLLCTLAIGFRYAMLKPKVRDIWHRYLLATPLLGSLLLKLEVARLSYMLQMLVTSGVPLVNALAISRDSLSNHVLRKALDRSRDLVKDGVRLSKAIESQKAFPELFVQLVTVGEESAKLAEVLREVGRVFDEETKTAMQRIVMMITPLATIGLGGIVALVLAAILLAVLKVNDLAF